MTEWSKASETPRLDIVGVGVDPEFGPYIDFQFRPAPHVGSPPPVPFLIEDQRTNYLRDDSSPENRLRLAAPAQVEHHRLSGRRLSNEELRRLTEPDERDTHAEWREMNR